MTVQVVSETHKLTDGRSPATVLVQTICDMPDSTNRASDGAGPTSKDVKPNAVESDQNIGTQRSAALPAAQPPLKSGRKRTCKKVLKSERGASKPTDDGPTAQAIHTTEAVVRNERAHGSRDVHIVVSPLVAEITQLWRMRQRWHRAEKALVLQGKAICRSWSHGDKEAGAKLFESAADGVEVDAELVFALMPFLSAIEKFQSERGAIEKRLKKLAVGLSVYPWVKAVKGFGELRLAAIVGESGNIGGYRNPSCLWKRMGLAVIRGERQRRASEADLAIEMGYSPQRRSIAYLLGQEILRGAALAEDKTYRSIYDSRKEYEFPRCEEMTDIMKKKFGKYSPKAHAHNRAMRYMTKRVLRDLWAAWRQSDGTVTDRYDVGQG